MKPFPPVIFKNTPLLPGYMVDWQQIQTKWQQKWAAAELGKAKVKKSKEKFFMIFAYPGISGYLHVGHMRGFSYADAICRYERLQGKEVLFPVGTHASGNQAIAFANKVKNKDKIWIEYLRRNGCPEKTIPTLSDPHKVIAYFNHIYVHDYWKKFGFLCDWGRFTCTTYPDYERFIQWQFQKLQQKDLLVQKPYFATACIEHGPVAVDPSETDISKGGNAEKVEYTLLKFKANDIFLVAATLRPETVFGQTNLWINPDAKYVKVQVGREYWILSREAAEKLAYQKDNVVILGDIDPKTLLGKYALAPTINREIIILPAAFCDPQIGTGIVTSVPSDAPDDYLGLKMLRGNHQMCLQYGLNSEELKKIELISIIDTRGYGEFPAQEIIEKHHITSFNDPKLEEENKEIYRAGHHTGIMKEACGLYAGKRVEEARELIKAELLQQEKADVFHDLSEEVLCRCGNKVVIKRIDDQWFIKYSDPELTERSKEQAKEMRIFPEEYYHNLPQVLEWFQDRACVRLGNWLGSKFPFDSRWTIEPISDSTLYPAYYVVSKFVCEGAIKTEELSEEFFDYVFLGQGQGRLAWKHIKEEFDYFYPLDLNLGGKEHQTVHFPVFLMNHVAILPEEKWPRGIFVNWWVIGKGSKISKSKGGAEPIPDAIERYGVDSMRLYYAHIGSPHVDVAWDPELALNYKNSLERIYNIVQEVRTRNGEKRRIDDWLFSRTQQHFKSINDSMKSYNLREVASVVYFAMYDDLHWYVRRQGKHRPTLETFIGLWCQVMNPITPHLSEELALSPKLVSAGSWPAFEEKKINLRLDAGEELLRSTMESMRTVVSLAKLQKPGKFTLFVAENWLYSLFALLHKEIQVTHSLGEIMKRVLEKEQVKINGKEVSKIVTAVVKDPSKLPSLVLSQEEELAIMNDALGFLNSEFGCAVEIIAAEDSDHPKAKTALPGKIGIWVE